MNNFNYGRIFNKYSVIKLIRLKTFFIYCKYPFLVKNMNKFYNISVGVLGHNLTNKLIKTVYGDIFLGGENSSELEVCLQELKNEGILGIGDYAREFLLANEENVY
jgi:hypothetical protein